MKMSPNEIRKYIQVAKGQDPDAQQIVNDFLKMNNNLERTNLPTTKAVICVAQLEFASNWLYPNDPENPFALMEDAITTAFMARKGEKSKQFVDIVRNTHDLSSLQGQSEEVKTGVLSGFFRRGGRE